MPGFGEIAKRDRPRSISETQAVPQDVALTDITVSKVRSLLEIEGYTDLSLRITIQPDGCSRLRYQLYFDDRKLDEDIAMEYDDMKTIADRMSAPYLGRTSINFVDTIERQGSATDNPNATGACVRDNSLHQAPHLVISSYWPGISP